jgi:hypothetical protein
VGEFDFLRSEEAIGVNRHSLEAFLGVTDSGGEFRRASWEYREVVKRIWVRSPIDSKLLGDDGFDRAYFVGDFLILEDWGHTGQRVKDMIIAGEWIYRCRGISEGR